MSVCNIKTNLPYWNDLSLSPIIDSSLVLWMTSDFGSSSLWDDRSGYNNNGIIKGPTRTPIHSSGVFGSGISVNASGQYVDVSNSISTDITTAITVEAWINPSAIPIGNGIVLTKNERYILRMNSGTLSPRFTFKAAGLTNIWRTVQGLSSIPIGTYSHIVGVYDVYGGTNNTKLYINGNISNQTTFSELIESTTGNINIGGYSLQTSSYILGLIPEIRVYNRGLTAAEIAYNYSHSSPYYIKNNIS